MICAASDGCAPTVTVWLPLPTPDMVAVMVAVSPYRRPSPGPAACPVYIVPVYTPPDIMPRCGFPGPGPGVVEAAGESEVMCTVTSPGGAYTAPSLSSQTAYTMADPSGAGSGAAPTRTLTPPGGACTHAEWPAKCPEETCIAPGPRMAAGMPAWACPLGTVTASGMPMWCGASTRTGTGRSAGAALPCPSVSTTNTGMWGVPKLPAPGTIRRRPPAGSSCMVDVALTGGPPAGRAVMLASPAPCGYIPNMPWLRPAGTVTPDCSVTGPSEYSSRVRGFWAGSSNNTIPSYGVFSIMTCGTYTATSACAVPHHAMMARAAAARITGTAPDPARSGSVRSRPPARCGSAGPGGCRRRRTALPGR